jgi:phosphomannomutase
MNDRTNYPICLFDMDGTLTPARKKLDRRLLADMCQLALHADVGIVSGSPFEYIEQQCSELWTTIGGIPTNALYILPCNGTQVYRFDHTVGEFTRTVNNNMIEHLGSGVFQNLVRHCVDILSEYALKNDELHMTGNFLSYRGSMLNWCPIGRDSSHEQRSKFVSYDRDRECRFYLRKRLMRRLHKDGLGKAIVCTLGGNTSLDIYPSGWDKTFALDHFTTRPLKTFVGDKCVEEGNDRTIYEALDPERTSFMTSGPEETRIIITTKLVQAVALHH